MPINKPKVQDQESSESKIVITAQQSRFHELDDSALKDIDVKNLSIAVGKREILQHAHLTLKAGLRYVFVGRNGLGKSTLLKALAERRMPGIAPNIRFLLLDQTVVEKKPEEILGSTTESEQLSVLAAVVASDKIRQRLIDDSASLSSVLQGTSAETNGIIQVHRRLKLEHTQRELEEARLVAQHRSGARGSKARQVLLDKEAAVELAENILNEQNDSSELDVEVEAAVSMLESMQITLDAMGSSTLEARARSTLVGLGFSEEQIEGPVKKLSGGWQTRAALAAALIQKTDVLMLDEPTNFLDLPAVIWLQHYLTTDLPQDTTLLVTTHDRAFADAVAERLLILRANPPFTLETFTGTLSDYYNEMSRQIRRMSKMSEALDRKKEHIQSTIQKSVAAAKRSGDDKKLKQAASRKKKLDERMGMEVNSKGHRFKLNRDRPGWHNAVRGDIDVPICDPPVMVSFPDEPPELRNAGSLASLEDVSFTYKKARKPTLNGINLVIQPGSRTGLVGLNGSGKSTLVNLLTSRAAGSLSGMLTLHSQARVAHYTQHETSRLLAHGQTAPELTALSHLRQLHPSIPEQPLRALLSGLSLSPQAQANTPLAALSGGQLVRVALAECLLPTPPQLFILDEPTTHLDADSIIALIRALKQYKGALLVVSHDRFFMRCVVEGQSLREASANQDAADQDEGDGASDDDNEDDDASSPGRVYRLTRTSGRMILLERGMDEYEEIVLRQLAKHGIDVQ